MDKVLKQVAKDMVIVSFATFAGCFVIYILFI